MDKNDVARLLSKTRKLVARYHILEREMIKLREDIDDVRFDLSVLLERENQED